MLFASETRQAVIILICKRHAPGLMERLEDCSEGDWFILPAATASRMGYRPRSSHRSHAYAVFGFVGSVPLTRMLESLASINEGRSLCPDCVAYEWGIRARSLAALLSDPVCGSSVNCDHAFPLRHEEELFYFCSIGCRDEFKNSPRRYLT